ncbi:FecR family protein [Paraburkholderia sp. J67]|uniref:FecR family protein n=1 Tax=Paraburkholderia sp. J67 TaxID=2805435 RepID=UPI002ABE1BA8|nr:FecR domain-containing protein [Paraburkholderia sp. J67]
MERYPLDTDSPTTAAAAPAIDADVETQAATWLVRRQNGVAAQDEAAFQDWLARHPSHRLAYAQLDETWQRLDRLPQQDVARWRAERAGEQREIASDKRRAGGDRARAAVLASPGRRAFLPRFAVAGTAFAAAGAGVIGWEYWQNSPTFSAQYQTRRGELQTVSLPDGSKMDLDTDTHVEANLYRHRREIRLLQGQAMFTVQSDPHCPFHVLAQAVTVTVVGTRFSVRCTQTGLEHGSVRVAVEEGRVRVATEAAGATGSGTQRSVELGAGQTVATDADGLLGAIDAISPAEVAVWRKGRVSFENTTLQRALEEFARYGATNIAVDDPAVAAMRITGSFDVHELNRFAHALPRVLPVRLRARGDHWEIVRSA